MRLLLVGIAAAAWGCFSAPSADVLFSCDPENAPQCPPEYSCQSDGCCHRDGSDVEGSRGACNSNATTGMSLSGTDTDPSTETGTAGSETDETGTDTDTDTDGTGPTTGEAGGSSSSTTG